MTAFPVPRRRFSPRRSILLLACLALALLAGVHSVSAQTLRKVAAPFTVWLDFRALADARTPRMALPIWLESVVSEHPRRAPGEPLTTVYRLRLRRLGELNKEIQFRLFFEDETGLSPEVTGWTETGTLRYRSGPLGSQFGLSSSADLLIATQDVDYLEIAVPGDGDSVRGAFLSTVTATKGKAALDFVRAAGMADPFGREAEAVVEQNDSFLFGRVRAALIAEPVKLLPRVPVGIDFQLDRVPLLALVSFEVLNADIAAPPSVVLNGTSLGTAAAPLPDLADPAFRSQVVSGQAELRFRYVGWLRCEKLVPATALQPGVNQLELTVGSTARPVAVRAVEIQLKFPWEGATTP